MYVELKNGKENIKKNQKMHQGYTIATKTHAKIKKWRATSSFYMLIRLFCSNEKLMHKTDFFNNGFLLIYSKGCFVRGNLENHDPSRPMYLP